MKRGTHRLMYDIAIFFFDGIFAIDFCKETREIIASSTDLELVCSWCECSY